MRRGHTVAVKRSAFGSIEKRGDAWRIWWTVGGVRHSRTVHGSRADAARELARIQIDAGGCSRDYRWGEYWELRVLPSLDGVQPTTAADYARSWRRLAPFISEMWISQTSARFIETTLAKYARGTSAHDARLWRKMCRMAVSDGALARDPFVGLRVRQAPKKPKALIDAAAVPAWLESIRGLKYEPVLLCELGGGLRHEEACGLVWGDVSPWDYRGAVYAVVRVSRALTLLHGRKFLKAPKTETSGREVVIGEPFASRLLELKGEGPLLPSGVVDNLDPAAQFTNPTTMTHNWRVWCLSHGIPYTAPKNLRATFATLHGEAGSPDSLVSGAMGHADGTTKARNYQAITRRGLALIADNLAEFLDGFAPDTHQTDRVLPDGRRVRL